MEAPMDHAGVFQPSSFMAPDALAGAVQALALVLALVSSFRLLLRIAHTTDLVVHRVTMLAMLCCSVFAWLAFGYLFFRHKLETCIYWARWTCVVFYVVCKAVVYALFVEKAFLANKFMYKGPRLGNPLFRKLAAMWCVYGVLFVLLCFNAIAEYTPPRTTNGTLPEPGALSNGTGALGNATLLDGFCTFYVKPPASIPIVVYDLIFTSTLVYCFVKPLIEARKSSPKGSDSKFKDLLRKTTEKALTGARITLLASFLNFMGLVLFAMPFELCMMACTLDTVTNSLCADWMTPLRTAKKRPIVRRLSAKASLVVAAVVPAPLVRSFKGTSSGSSEGAAQQPRSDEPSTATAKSSGSSNSSKSRSSAASVHSVAVVPAP